MAETFIVVWTIDGETTSMPHSSGSPFADSAGNRLAASNNPNCPILASANHAITHEIRTARQERLFFEMPYRILTLVKYGGGVTFLSNSIQMNCCLSVGAKDF
jgi:hypothetical protein